VGLTLVGCAASHPREARIIPASPAPDFGAASASALVFASPVQSPYPLEGLAREPREASAFAGYDEQISETYVVVTDDEQGNWGWGDGYQRSSVTAKVGVRYR